MKSLTFNIKKINGFFRVTLYRNGRAFYSSQLMTESLANTLVSNRNYINVPTAWSLKVAD